MVLFGKCCWFHVKGRYLYECLYHVQVTASTW